MPELSISERGQLCVKILEFKFGSLWTWSVPEIENTVGPFDLEPFERFDLQRKDLISDCEGRLSFCTDNELLVLSGRPKHDPSDIKSEWSSFRESHFRELERMEPPWYAGGFGHPDYSADFKHWSQNPRFSRHEALMLSVGVEPHHLEERKVEELAERNAEGRAKLLKPLQTLLRRRDLIERQFRGRMQSPNISPRDLFAWFQLVDLDVHPEFTSKYLDTSKGGAYPAKPSTKPDQREINSICQLFTAIAIDSLGYDPHQKRSTVPKEIVDFASGMGLEISVDTVRKYLKRGAEIIPDDWTPPGR